MAGLDATVSGMIHSHDSLRGLLARASIASVHLNLNPNSGCGAEYWATGVAFVRAAVAHMGEEEEGTFVDAQRNGVPTPVLDALRDEHARLRVLAADLLHHGGPDDEGALLLLRFLHRFERHVAQEEWSLAARWR